VTLAGMYGIVTTTRMAVFAWQLPRGVRNGNRVFLIAFAPLATLIHLLCLLLIHWPPIASWLNHSMLTSLQSNFSNYTFARPVNATISPMPLGEAWRVSFALGCLKAGV